MGTWLDSARETYIEYIVAQSEAHDSGPCDVDAETKAQFASDLLNLTLVSPTSSKPLLGRHHISQRPDRTI